MTAPTVRTAIERGWLTPDGWDNPPSEGQPAWVRRALEAEGYRFAAPVEPTLGNTIRADYWTGRHQPTERELRDLWTD